MDSWNRPKLVSQTAPWLQSGPGGFDPFKGLCRAPKRSLGLFLGRFWPSLTPPANSIKFLWSQMACGGVPHLVLHILCPTRTYWGHIRPSEVSFWSFWANKANIPPFPHFRGGSQLGNGWVKWKKLENKVVTKINFRPGAKISGQ